MSACGPEDPGSNHRLAKVRKDVILRKCYKTYHIKGELNVSINMMLCPIKVKSNTIEVSCYCILDLLCVKQLIYL